MATDTDLDPLRGREDFKKLVVDIGRKSVPTNAPTPPWEKK